MVENQENIEIKTESLESEKPAGNLKDPDENPSEENPTQNPNTHCKFTGFSFTFCLVQQN